MPGTLLGTGETPEKNALRNLESGAEIKQYTNRRHTWSRAVKVRAVRKNEVEKGPGCWFSHICEEGTIFIPMGEMRKLKHRAALSHGSPTHPRSAALVVAC